MPVLQPLECELAPNRHGESEIRYFEPRYIGQNDEAKQADITTTVATAWTYHDAFNIQPASSGVWLGPLPRAYSEGEFCVPRLAIQVQNGPVTWESISF